MSSSLDALNHHGLQCMIGFMIHCCFGMVAQSNVHHISKPNFEIKICFFFCGKHMRFPRFTGKNPVKTKTSIRQAMGFSLSWTADITRQVQWRATNIRATQWLPFTMKGWISLHRTCQNKGRWIWVERACVTSDMYITAITVCCLLFTCALECTPRFFAMVLFLSGTSVPFSLLFFLSISLKGLPSRSLRPGPFENDQLGKHQWLEECGRGLLLAQQEHHGGSNLLQCCCWGA